MKNIQNFDKIKLQKWEKIQIIQENQISPHKPEQPYVKGKIN